MSWVLRISLLMALNTVTITKPHYVELKSEYHNVEPGAVVFPSSLSSPFNLPNRIHNHEKNEDLSKEYLHAVEALFAVTTRLKTFLGKDITNNVLVSPISTTTALGEILLGARGGSRRLLLDMLTTVNRTSGTAEATVVEFHQQLGGLIKLLQNSPEYDESYQLDLASAMFLNPHLHLKGEFITAISDLYGAEIEPMDFSGDPVGSMMALNLWASRHTRGVINQIFTEPLPRSTAVVLTNAIYFKGDWETPFDPEYTIPGVFKVNEGHEVNVQYMRGEFEIMHVENPRLGCQMIAIPYKKARAAMYVVLPNNESNYNIHAFAASLHVRDIRELISSMESRSVTLVMPKMTLTQSFSIKKALSEFQKQVELELDEKDNNHRNKKLLSNEPHIHEMSCNSSARLELGTNRRADLRKNYTTNDGLDFDMSGASPDENFRVDDIIHQIYLDINEFGTVAAAITATTVDKIGDITNFIMNRPFVFFIRQEVTGTPLFWGAIVDPTKGVGA